MNVDPGFDSRPSVAVGEPLSLRDVFDVARGRARVTLSAKGEEAVVRARAAVERLLEDDARATYGVNTGFGALAETRVASEDLAELQHRLVRSHAVGVGELLDVVTTRAMMLLRAHVLALGYSGVRPRVVHTVIDFLNRGVHPCIPSQGSVGASGDLAPLAHLALALIGEGAAEFEGITSDFGETLTRAGIEPLRLEAKEGLSLINGTQGMLAIGVLELLRAESLCVTADVTGAMSLEALKGSTRPFDTAVVEARPHPGALAVAEHLRALLADSEIGESHVDCHEVQDAYSLRCMPQVHGAARDMLAYARRVLEVEVNSATDNPLVLPDGRIQSGGNFHGQPVAACLDAAALAMADLASIAERRLAQLVDPNLNRGFNPFLALEPGLNSGFMMAQVTAAALVSEAKALAYPNSVDTIPTSADREDHVSMGMTAARHFKRVLDCLEHVLSIEAVVAGEGVRQRGLSPGKGVRKAIAKVQKVVPAVTEDRPFFRDFDQVRVLVKAGALARIVE